MPSGSEPRGGGGGGDLPVPFRFLPPGVSARTCVWCVTNMVVRLRPWEGGAGAERLGAAHRLLASDDSRASCLAWAAKAVGLGEATGPGWLEIWMIACSLTCSSSIIDKLVYHT